MAATYLDIQTFPKNTIAGDQFQFRLTARNAAGTVDTGYTGTVTFTAPTDPDAKFPTPYTFVGGDAGTKLLRVKMATVGPQTFIADDGAIRKATARTAVQLRPPGWGLDDEGILPYGDSAAAIGANIVAAHAISTREVTVSVSNLVQDSSPFLAGDALNPATWTLQRLDNNVFLHVVNVTQVGTYSYTLLTLEEFGPVTVTHVVGSTTLHDLGGGVINPPRSATFLGILDEVKNTLDDQLAAQKVGARDIANPQLTASPYVSGTLQLGGDGDYQLEKGTPLLKKLILRRLTTTPGDFFHLPNYGIGLRLKEPPPPGDLGRLKVEIEQQILKEPELSDVQATLLMDPANGLLIVKVVATEKTTGEKVSAGYQQTASGGVVL